MHPATQLYFSATPHYKLLGNTNLIFSFSPKAVRRQIFIACMSVGLTSHKTNSSSYYTMACFHIQIHFKRWQGRVYNNYLAILVTSANNLHIFPLTLYAASSPLYLLSVLKADKESVHTLQTIFIHCAKCNSLASIGLKCTVITKCQCPWLTGLMTSKLTVDTTSDCPPDKNAMPGTATGIVHWKTVTIAAASLSGV